MAVFKDSKGREWTVTVDTTTVKPVRAATEVDLLDTSGRMLERLADEPSLLVDVLWVLCSDEAKQRGVSDVQFGQALVGDSIDAATTALMEAVTDFFPSRKRDVLRRASAMADRVRQKGTDMAMAKIDNPELEAKLLATMEAEMDEKLRTLLSRFDVATPTPESAE
jgi:hypothetical protein